MVATDNAIVQQFRAFGPLAQPGEVAMAARAPNDRPVPPG
jgi:hypothetical protein